jgi:hypothetical protein
VEKEEKKALERSSGSGRAPHAATARTTHGTTTHPRPLFYFDFDFLFSSAAGSKKKKNGFFLRSIDRHWNFRE